MTHGGENAEAYFSHDGQRLIFQSTRDGRTCDQQYTMRIDGSDVKRVSNGQGKTTCGYYMDGDRRIFFASTHATDTTCPPKPDPSKGYVWGLDPFDIYSARADGSGLRRLTSYGVYTAEGDYHNITVDLRVNCAVPTFIIGGKLFFYPVVECSTIGCKVDPKTGIMIEPAHSTP